MKIAFVSGAAKGIGETIVRRLAKETTLSGITVNSISPGVILTDMTSKFGEDTVNALKKEIPLGRIGIPEDIAGVISFLASDDAGYITGQDIAVNGGMYI